MQKVLLLLLACPALALVPSRSLMPRATRVNIPRATVKAVISESAPATQHGQETPWSPSSWRSKDVEQLPVYEDEKTLLEAEAKLAKCAPLVFAGEIRTLSDSLAQAQSGQAFLLMGGDCAESFEQFDTDKVRDSFRVILQMALVLTFGGSVPVIKVGRIAGQFAKPRSSGMETRDGVSLPSYRGDNVNGEDFTVEARTPDPNRMLKAYNQCAQTLNIIRAFSTGGYAAIERLHAWNLDFVGETEQGSRYRQLATKVDESLRFMKAIGMNTEDPAFTTTAFYTAHECLLLPYEEALTRQDSTTGLWYDCSAHMLWVGERTRQLKNAHLEFCKGVGNPIGIKISDKCDPMDLVRLTEILNPLNTPGRLTIIVRMGAEKLRENLPDLVTTVEKEGRKVLWISDPVHGNTITTASGFKTRDFSAIRAELRAFFDVHEALGTHAGGVHLEMTGEDVTECIGGLADISVEDLELRYKTQCDPRLNGNQALEIAFLIAERMRKRMGLPPVVV